MCFPRLRALRAFAPHAILRLICPHVLRASVLYVPSRLNYALSGCQFAKLNRLEKKIFFLIFSQLAKLTFLR